MPSSSQYQSIVVRSGATVPLVISKEFYDYRNDCARLILDADTHDNSVKLFKKLHWLPIDDIIRIRKLYLLHKINQGHCPAYFNKYIEHISNTHNYNTRSASNNNITTPACKRNSGLRTFHSSACRLWNALDPEPKTLSHTNFKNYLVKFYRSMTSFLDHFKIRKTFQFHQQ